MEDLKAKITLVADAVRAYENEVMSSIEVYVKYLEVSVKLKERPEHMKKLAAKLIQLSNKVEALNSKVERVRKKELAKSKTAILETFDKVKNALTLVGSLHKVYKYLIEICKLQDKNKYRMCMAKILEADKLVLGLCRNYRLPVMEDLNLSINAEKCQLLEKLSNVLKDSVILQTDALGNSIKISNKNVEEVLSALYLNGTSITSLDNITIFLLEHIFIPVIDFPTKIKVCYSSSFATMKIMVDATKKPSYSEIFTNIETILYFLENNFFYQSGKDMTTFGYIGRDIRDNLSELNKYHCLQDTISSQAEGVNQKLKTELKSMLEYLRQQHCIH